ncbi:YadA-like family protein [uncultured Haemophilus sp.]|uniref:YadA-like family protein n=1 Tax=uncultured Haemophilus sp. TaxID=237779 RepID=UPI0026215F38|nr:YadA-like family protein [uncultured Haemophilus sp.]
MNHVFKIIWNKVNQCWVAVSELSKSVGKSSQTDKRKALNVIIGAAVLAGVSTSAMAETNVVVNDKGTVIGGTGAVADRTNAVVLGNSANSNTADSIAIGTGAKVEGDADYNKYNIAIGNKARSTNRETVAIGNNADGWGTGGVAIGGGSNASGRGTAIGYGAKASGIEGLATAIGNEANASGRGAIAMGNGAKSSGNDAISLGFIANASGENAVSIGVRSVASGQASAAYGIQAQATAERSIALGVVSKATGGHSVALGDSSRAYGHWSTAVGSIAVAKGYSATALGDMAHADGSASSALGHSSNASGSSSIAIGDSANSSQTGTVAIGVNSKSSAEYAIALGGGANASGRSSVAIGDDTKAEGYNSVAMGRNSKASETNSAAILGNATGISSIAIGGNATAANSVALGSDSTNTHEDSVALGSSSAGAKNVFDDTATKLQSFNDDASSKTINYNGTSSYKTIIDFDFGDSFTKESTGAVSVGDGSLVRQIQNVGAGRITAESNDAVNGSQLYQAYYNAGFNIKNNGKETSRINTHGKVNFVNGKNTEVVVKDGENAADITVNLKDDITVNNVTAKNVTVGPVTINKDGINAGDKKITNVSNGTISADSKDAVNGSQLYAAKNELNTNITKAAAAAKTEVKAGTNVEVTSETGANNQTIYTVNAKDTSASVDAGSDAITVTVGEPTKVTGKDGVTVTTVTNYKVDLSQKTKDEIKNAGGRGFNVTASASEGTVVNEVAEETVQSTATKMDKLTLDAGKNIKLTHKKGKVLSVAVSDTPTFKNVTTTGDVNVGGTIHAHGGLDMHNNRIVNVADPKDPTDAVNKRYVDNAVKNINNNINRLDNKIDHVDRKLRAGIAGATAISFLQRPNEAGKSLVSVGVGGYRNENAIAVGYGRNSDNNKISIKVGASINTRSDVNWGGSIGYQW